MIRKKIRKFLAKKTTPRKTKGQSLVEVALTFPILLMLLSGLTEFGFLLNHYLALVDATREAARLASSWGHDEEINGVTFYQATTGNVIAALEPKDAADTTRKVPIRDNRVNCTTADLAKGVCDNEIIISVYSIDGTLSNEAAGAALVESHHWDDNDQRQVSRFTVDEINSRLQGETTVYAGILVVEAFYNYEQVLALPWVGVMMPDPFLLHAYSIMPLSSAEPQVNP